MSKVFKALRRTCFANMETRGSLSPATILGSSWKGESSMTSRSADHLQEKQEKKSVRLEKALVSQSTMSVGCWGNGLMFCLLMRHCMFELAVGH